MRFLMVSLVFILMTGSAVAQDRLDIGFFSQQDIAGWQQKEFAGKTTYSVQQIDDRSVLHAVSAQSASAWYKKVKIDLQKTPYMNWSWFKKTIIRPADEDQKAGDDFVARAYVIRDGGVFFWKTRAINYVWSFTHTRGEVWENPFAGKNAMMLSLRDASDEAGVWVTEKRNITQDFERLHGEKLRFIDGVALMTDSDNSGLSAEAYYGDIYFTAE